MIFIYNNNILIEYWIDFIYDIQNNIDLIQWIILCSITAIIFTAIIYYSGSAKKAAEKIVKGIAALGGTGLAISSAYPGMKEIAKDIKSATSQNTTNTSSNTNTSSSSNSIKTNK